MTTFSAVLGLFGFCLTSASPVFASDSLDESFKQCQSIKPKGDFSAMKRKKDCFKELVGDERQAAAKHIHMITNNFNVEVKELDTTIEVLCITARHMLSRVTDSSRVRREGKVIDGMCD